MSDDDRVASMHAPESVSGSGAHESVPPSATLQPDAQGDYEDWVPAVHEMAALVNGNTLVDRTTVARVQAFVRKWAAAPPGSDAGALDSMDGLVLSLFPGIGLLDMAFEEEGFCVVRGPDLLWGGDIRRFHPPAGKFAGVIGGPPCQAFSGLANFAYRWKHPPENLIPEFERIVTQAAPRWFVMENVPAAPLPAIDGYRVIPYLLNNRDFGGEQNRQRRISIGGLRIDRHLGEIIVAAPINGSTPVPTVTSAHGGGRPRMKGRIQKVTLKDVCALQGVPDDFFGPRSPLAEPAKKKLLVEGVPLPMGRAVARAVKRALQENTA